MAHIQVSIGEPCKRVVATFVQGDSLQLVSFHQVLEADSRFYSPACFLLCWHPIQVQEYTVRLLNGMAGKYIRRSYLCDNPSTITTLMTFLKKLPNDTAVRKFALSTIQKLSLR